ncbi:MAG: hypothetical protein J6D06_01795 [Clostridia bacterium]|nr:hypothetical protein [Clostridia bacterium]
MANIFIDLFNMSITASYLVLAVVIARLLLKKAPKWINCLLWALVGIRLICPFSFESALSLVPSSQAISLNDSSIGRPFTVQSGVPVVDSSVNDFLGDKYYEGVTVPANTFADMTTILSIIWLVGLFAMLIYGLISFIRLRKRVGASILFKDNVYYCDNIDTPFILGLVKPKIYIPSGLSEEQVEFITLHEKAHLKRKDHFWKPLGFILLSVYWFNPVMWVAYILLCRDVETACDEKVIKNMTNTEKKSYSETLVSCSIQRRMIMACPLAFGEVGVKQRIKSVLNYKKPTFWVIILAFVLFTVVAVCFISNPVNNKVDKILNEDGYTISSAEEKKISFQFISKSLTEEMFEKDGVYKVNSRDILNNCVHFNLKEVRSHDDAFDFTFDVTYNGIPNNGTIYVPDSAQFNGGLELGDEIKVSDPFGATDGTVSYSSYCFSKGPGTEFCFAVPKKWFENKRNNKIVVELDVIEVVFVKQKSFGNSSSIGIIGGADGPTSIIISDNKNENMGTPTLIHGDFYQAVINLKSELRVYGLYYRDKATGEFRLVDKIGTVSPYFVVQDEALYYTSDYRLKSVSLNGDFKITVYAGVNNSSEQEYSIERIELIKDGKIYCKAKKLNEIEPIYLAIKSDNSSFDEISKNDIPIDASQFENILANIQTTLDTECENILVKGFRINYTSTGNIDEAIFNVWVYNGTKNNEDFWIEGNVLITFDNTVFFNVINEEIVLLSEYNPKNDGSLQTIDDIIGKVNIAALQTKNIDKTETQPEHYLLTMGTLFGDEKYVKYVAGSNPVVEYMQEKNGKFVPSSKPHDLTLETYYPANKIYFILVPKYTKGSVENYIFEESESTVSGNFKVLLFDK